MNVIIICIHCSIIETGARKKTKKKRKPGKVTSRSSGDSDGPASGCGDVTSKAAPNSNDTANEGDDEAGTAEEETKTVNSTWGQSTQQLDSGP